VNLLNHVLLPGAVFLDRGTGGLSGREEVLHSVTTVLANLVTELEAVNFAHAPDRQSIPVRAARGRGRRRHDPARVVVARRFVCRVRNDVFGQTMRTFF
jgi:hypothetical protein